MGGEKERACIVEATKVTVPYRFKRECIVGEDVNENPDPFWGKVLGHSPFENT